MGLYLKMQTEKGHEKNYYALASILSVGALVSGLLLRKNLLDYSPALGLPLIGFFALPFFSLLYIVVIAWKNQKLKGYHLIISCLIFLFAALPFCQSFFQDIHHNWWDDGYRYSICAHNMVDNHTLWGGDRLVIKTTHNRYAFQAGYRYFLALEFLILKHENRLLQIINILLWVMSIGLLIKNLQRLSLPDILFKGCLIFIVGSSIYATKNILMGLSEWFCVLLVILYLVCMIQKRIILAIVPLALAVFVRQNQIFCISLFFLLTLIQTNKKSLVTMLFFAIILLPVYHNLYYDHSWAFYPDYNSYYLYFIPDSTGNQLLDFLEMLLNTTLRYLGFDWHRNLSANFFGIIFIPFGVVMVIMMTIFLKGFNRKILIGCTILAFLSSIVLNWAYFPRFEFTNLFFVLTGFTLLWQLQLRSVNLEKYISLLVHKDSKRKITN